MIVNFAKKNGYEIGKYNGSMWLKVFFHNHKTRENFKDELEALHCNSEYKYSILDEINSKMKISGKYEFIMEFPDDGFHIRWEQNRNPVNELDNKEQADGLKIFEDTTTSKLQSFGGLTRSTQKREEKINCFLDGVPANDYWYYAIGMYENSANDYSNKGIPTFKSYSDSIKLWIKIDPKRFLESKTACYIKRSLYINIFIVNFLSN